MASLVRSPGEVSDSVMGDGVVSAVLDVGDHWDLDVAVGVDDVDERGREASFSAVTIVLSLHDVRSPGVLEVFALE